MSEGIDGLYVSTVNADVDWQADEETGGLVHMIRSDDSVQVGLWKPGPVAGTSIEFRLEADETLLVLTGSGRLRVDGGSPVALQPGVIVSLPKGAHTSWIVDEAFCELWVYS
jgi:uncharacterized cupin superfamily protein